MSHCGNESTSKTIIIIMPKNSSQLKVLIKINTELIHALYQLNVQYSCVGVKFSNTTSRNSSTVVMLQPPNITVVIYTCFM